MLKVNYIITSFVKIANLKIMSSKRKNSNHEEDSDDIKKNKPQGHWAAGLLTVMEDPECVVKTDDMVVIIKDKYPKAEHHFLVLSKEDISSLNTINTSHLDLLKHMQKIAEELVAEPTYKGKTFRIGYHAEASMYRLHLHVISDDMNSPCVKTKKHWNSFTTNFFIDGKDILQMLESEGKITLPSRSTCKDLLDTPLKCHKCDYIPKHMPDLKKHILKHE